MPEYYQIQFMDRCGQTSVEVRKPSEQLNTSLAKYVDTAGIVHGAVISIIPIFFVQKQAKGS